MLDYLVGKVKKIVVFFCSSINVYPYSFYPECGFQDNETEGRVISYPKRAKRYDLASVGHHHKRMRNCYS